MSEFKKLQGIPLFQSVAASMADTFSQSTSPLTSVKPLINQTSPLLFFFLTPNSSTLPISTLYIDNHNLLSKIMPAKIHEVR